MNKVEKILRDNIDLPTRKIKQILHEPSWLNGAFGILLNYNLELDESSWRIFVDIISEKLSTDDVEYEFTEVEFNNLLNLKKLPVFKHAQV